MPNLPDEIFAPQARLKSCMQFQASLRDAMPHSPLPGVETPGYYQRSLRDKVGILVSGRGGEKLGGPPLTSKLVGDSRTRLRRLETRPGLGAIHGPQLWYNFWRSFP